MDCTECTTWMWMVKRRERKRMKVDAVFCASFLFFSSFFVLYKIWTVSNRIYIFRCICSSSYTHNTLTNICLSSVAFYVRSTKSWFASPEIENRRREIINRDYELFESTKQRSMFSSSEINMSSGGGGNSYWCVHSILFLIPVTQLGLTMTMMTPNHYISVQNDRTIDREERAEHKLLTSLCMSLLCMAEKQLK